MPRRRASTVTFASVFAKILDGDVYKYYADDEWKKSASGKTVAIINPTTKKTLQKVKACTQEEVNKAMESAKSAQKAWANTPLWKLAELLHKATAILKFHNGPIVECLVKEISKPDKDVTEVVRPGDLVSYCSEEGVRIMGEWKFLVSDNFPGNKRTKYFLTSKIVSDTHMPLLHFLWLVFQKEMLQNLNYPLKLQILVMYMATKLVLRVAGFRYCSAFLLPSNQYVIGICLRSFR